jgi:hypothetical protein
MDEWYSLLANNRDLDGNPLDPEEWSLTDLATLIRLAEVELARRHEEPI